ncbi:MAG: hypothetical protein A2048_05115 [Deltaproteobacteria bacterium GWA2_45_12]|nr:MAG: hypothetical protein A2048_05115 [Deltaproteobacteria bacterium GWA2_45_12]
MKTRLREVSREHHISFDGQSFSLSPEQADQIARRFFKDLGIDLDLPPFYKIVPDLKSRDLKMKGYLAKNIDGGSLISLNFANDQFSLRELSGLLHEYGHAIHHILAAQASGKSRTRGIAVAAEPFMEGVGKMLNRIVYSKGFMQTYLKDVDGFKEPVIQDVLADTYQDQFAAVAILGINDALIEAELYDIVSSHPEKNIAQDLKRLIDKHYRGLLGIDWANLVNVLPLAFHFPGYRGNYALGYEWAGKSLSDVLDVFVDEKGNDKKTVDADELKEAGKQLRTLFAKLDYDYDLKKSFQVKE